MSSPHHPTMPVQTLRCRPGACTTATTHVVPFAALQSGSIRVRDVLRNALEAEAAKVEWRTVYKTHYDDDEWEYGKGEYVKLQMLVGETMEGGVVALEGLLLTTDDQTCATVTVTQWTYDASGTMQECDWKPPDEPCMGCVGWDRINLMHGSDELKREAVEWEPIKMCVVPISATPLGRHSVMEGKSTLLFVQCTAHKEKPHVFCLARGRTGYREASLEAEKDVNVFVRCPDIKDGAERRALQANAEGQEKS